MYSAFDHWAYWSHMLTVISMFSPCTQWVFGALSPVSTTRPTGPLHPLPVPDDRGNSVAINFIGPLLEDEGFDCIVTMTDQTGADIRVIPTPLVVAKR